MDTLRARTMLWEVTRARVVKVRGLDEKGKQKSLRAEGLLARVLQHEIDHLDGVLICDKAHQSI